MNGARLLPWLIVLLLILMVLLGGAAAQDLAITHVRAHPIAGPDIEDATILIAGESFHSLGRDLAVPPGTRVIDGRGLEAYPGFIDCWTSLGLSEIASVAGSVDTTEIGDWNAHLRAAAAVNPHSEHLPVARVNGITTALVAPGGGIFQGRPAILDLLGRTVPQMEVEADPPLLVLQIPAPPPRTYTEKEDKDWDPEVEKGWKKLEEHLARAKRLSELLDNLPAEWGRDLEGQERLSLLALARHLKAERPFLVRADSREHILATLRFAEKHGLKLVLAGLREGWKAKDRLKAAGHRLIVGPPFPVPDRDDPYDSNYGNAAAMARAGLSFGIMSGSSPNVRNLPYQAAMMVAFGLPREAAWRAMTLGGAEAIGIARTHGSLEPGKAANLVLWRGDPLDARTNPEVLIIRGQPVPLHSRHVRLSEPFIPR
jgi:imidazolonepropionase-like amidohydrolase